MILVVYADVKKMVDTLSEMGILMISWDETVGWWRYLLWRDESVLVGLHIVIIILQKRIGFLGSRVMLGLSVLAVPVVQNILAIAVLAMRCAYPNLGPTLFFSSSFFLRTISFWTFAFPDPIVFRIAFYSLSLHKNSKKSSRSSLFSASTWLSRSTMLDHVKPTSLFL